MHSSLERRDFIAEGGPESQVHPDVQEVGGKGCSGKHSFLHFIESAEAQPT